MRILIVEDDVINTHLYRMIFLDALNELHINDVNIDTFRGFYDFSNYGVRQYDAALVDWRLCDGYVGDKIIDNIHVDYSNVIVISACDDMPTYCKDKNIKFIKKPISDATMHSIIHIILQGVMH